MKPLQPIPFQNRLALAAKVRKLKQAVAKLVTEDFLGRHPDWLVRHGEHARQLGLEEALYHLDFLASSIEAGTDAPFQDYARWTAGVSLTRGIAPTFLSENLRQIEDALSPHLSETEGATLTQYIRAGCAAIELGAADPIEGGKGKLSLTQGMFLQALLVGQRKAAATVALEAVHAGHAILDIYAEVIQETLYSVGRRWAANEITVAQEHTATAIAQYVLALLYERQEPAQTQRGKAVITGVEGELHQVGANMVADALEADGWDVRFLGTNMPHEGILKIVQEHEATVLGISATMLFNLPKVCRLITDIRQQSGAKVRIVVGGGAFFMAPQLYAEIGADGFATGVREAILLILGFAV